MIFNSLSWISPSVFVHIPLSKKLEISAFQFFAPFTQPGLLEVSSYPLWLSNSLSTLLFPPPPDSGTMSLPWLGGCNLLQAAGQAEWSPSYLDKGSPGKSYQSEGVFKYSRNCGNHFLLSLRPPPTALKAPPSVPLTFSLKPPQQAPAIPNSLTFFFPLAFQNNLPLPQHFLF